MESAHEQVFLARQPIFNRHRRVVGYELLFRGPHGAHGASVSLDEQGAAVITEAVLAFGLDTLTHGRPAFVHVSPHVLLSGLPSALPPHQVVVQLPGDIDASREVLGACADLRRRGYRVALEHVASTDGLAALLKHADYLKSDVPGLQAATSLAEQWRDSVATPAIVATGVQTAADFAAAAKLGCASFQGDFIGRPVLRSTHDIPANRLHYLRLFNALQNPDLSPRELEDLIKPDASLVYRVLRAVNSAAFARHSRVDSLRQALVLLGCGTVRQWAALWTMTAFSQGVPDELVAMSTVRGRTCEIIASTAPSDEFGDGFLLGMCSLLSAILEVPLAGVLEHLPLPGDVEAALRGTDNNSRRLLKAVVAYEHGEWDQCMMLSEHAGLDRLAVPNAYGQALRWYARFQEDRAA
jgi:EAL and modified HD-GYP domain-containing signal transduction protein